MMSSENIPPVEHPPEHHHSGAAARKPTVQKPQEQPPALKCPRCDSSNTKFCYYNNYSLTQPRHFCKTCRRYWTKGGALRNVPIGGGCRKTKKHKPSSSSSCPTPSSSSRLDLSAGPGAEFKFLAPPSVAPAMEFQLGGLSLPRLHPATAGVYTQFISSSGAHYQPVGVGPGAGGCYGLDLLGPANYPSIPNSGNSSSSSSSSLSLAGGVPGGGDHTISISSFESLSSINQELHWKLQQQRLAMIYGPSSIDQDDDKINNHHQEKALGGGGGGICLFKNLESTRNNNKIDVGGPTPTEWLFDQIQTNSVANYADNDNGTTVDVTAANTTSCNNNNNHEDFDGVWTTAELHHHHHHHQHQHHQFNGLQ